MPLRFSCNIDFSINCTFLMALQLSYHVTTFSLFIEHSTKLLDSDWTTGVQLIPNCTLQSTN